ncbi:MAG: hypothetical protein K1X90_06965 [Candidatus Kapabacteria bacterium]|nr:hypothetical protein [Candidatus Kapabacteria bacterium]
MFAGQCCVGPHHQHHPGIEQEEGEENAAKVIVESVCGHLKNPWKLAPQHWLPANGGGSGACGHIAEVHLPGAAIGDFSAGDALAGGAIPLVAVPLHFLLVHNRHHIERNVPAFILPFFLPAESVDHLIRHKLLHRPIPIGGETGVGLGRRVLLNPLCNKQWRLGRYSNPKNGEKKGSNAMADGHGSGRKRSRKTLCVVITCHAQ